VANGPDVTRVCVCVCSPLAAFLYGGSSPPETIALPDCGPVPQPPPALLPASLDWPLEEKELPDPFATKVPCTVYCGGILFCFA